MRILLIFIMLYITSCSFKPPKNQWQFKSSNSFDLYIQNFLKSNDKMAKNNLKRAISNAKNSSDFTQLAKIYLGRCAIRLSVGESIDCRNYQKISHLVLDKKLEAYYHLLNLSIKTQEIIYLPKIYQPFAIALVDKNYSQAIQEILKQDKITSKLISARLIKDRLDNQSKNKIIEEVSFYGYKKSVIFWLKELKNSTIDKRKKAIITQKIYILEN